MFSLLPLEIVKYCAEKFCDSESAKSIAQVDKRTRNFFLSYVSCITILQPREGKLGSYPKNILVNVIQRYKKLDQVTFVPRTDSGNVSAFTNKMIPYYEEFVTFLENDKNQHLLKNLKTIKFIANRNEWGTDNKDFFLNIEIIYKRLFNVLSNTKLENLHIEYDFSSLFMETAIQSMLDKAPRLKQFVLINEDPYEEVELSFKTNPNLECFKFEHCKINISTLASLSKCHKLEKFESNFSGSNDDVFKALCGENFSNLTHLCLKGAYVTGDENLNAITENKKNLSFLDVIILNVTEEGFENIGVNCPNLRTLNFSHWGLTNLSLDMLTKKLPFLENISFDSTDDVISDGFMAMTANCRNLKSIKISSPLKLNREKLEALANNCLKIETLDFGASTLFDFEAMGEYLPQMANFRNFNSKNPCISPSPPRL